ncbi:MAG: Asp-tRNA(Asn)/Glu-tRNA(Gln) amidotransferase subunit GatA [Candidatus Buchananbacteria bacterium]|nr:Asp-tRNA(Asn)/Glu-tRNA(Gln) amidotransferase subunit GatA [Candidatus Buchananbacteria bacterium]
MELNQLTIKQANEGLKKKEFSSVDLTKACFEQIKKVDDKVKSFISLTENYALDKARKVDEVGNFSNPLSGIPVGIKDIYCTKGIKTTAASKILENYVPPFSATAVEKLEEQGAVMVGKNNLDEFAMGSSTENSGFFPTKNPWDLQRVPGGSSGGSAAAVASDQCFYSLGTDTGCSIRLPAAFCGVTGLKVTYGRVSRYGVMSYASSFDTMGPIARTVEDVALVMKTIAGQDLKDSTTPNIVVPDYSKGLDQEIKGLKIGLPKEYFAEGVDEEMKKVVEQAIKKLESLGAKIVEISLPLTKYAIPTYYILVKSEASTNLERYDGIRYGLSAQANSLMEKYLETRGAGFGPEVKRSIMMGTYTLSAGYYDAYYNKAAQVRTLIKQEFQKAFEQVDCMVTPSTPFTAFKIGEKVDDPLQMYLADILSCPINIAGVPALSVPCGFVKPKDGENEMPVGMQIIGKQFDEQTILRVGHQYQQATDWHKRKPGLK